MSIQQALDEFEAELLTDLFGGTTAEHMVLRKGVFKMNVSDTVNSLIQKFESLVKPRMSADGTLKVAKVEARPLELYRELKQSFFGAPTQTSTEQSQSSVRTFL
jgi:hypothetical protein